MPYISFVISILFRRTETMCGWSAEISSKQACAMFLPAVCHDRFGPVARALCKWNAGSVGRERSAVDGLRAVLDRMCVEGGGWWDVLAVKCMYRYLTPPTSVVGSGGLSALKNEAWCELV